MIHSLRRRHFHGFATLAVVLPIAYGIGLAARTGPAVQPSIPAPLLGDEPGVELAEEILWSRGDLWGDLPIDTMLRRAPDDGRVLELTPREDLRQPELLAYWSPGLDPELGLGDRAVLLGRLGGTAPRRFRLPAEVQDVPGRLVLYSLAHHDVVAQAAFPDPTP